MPQFVKRPTVVHAQQIWPSLPLEAWLKPYRDSDELYLISTFPFRYEMKTNHGVAYAEAGDWILQHADGEIEPIKDALFKETYEPVEAYEQAAIELPRIGSIWRHRNGALYVVMMHTNDAGDDPSKREKYPTTIAYVNIHNGKRYSRRADDWHRSFTPELFA